MIRGLRGESGTCGPAVWSDLQPRRYARVRWVGCSMPIGWRDRVVGWV